MAEQSIRPEALMLIDEVPEEIIDAIADAYHEACDRYKARMIELRKTSGLTDEQIIAQCVFSPSVWAADVYRAITRPSPTVPEGVVGAMAIADANFDTSNIPDFRAACIGGMKAALSAAAHLGFELRKVRHD